MGQSSSVTPPPGLTMVNHEPVGFNFNLSKNANEIISRNFGGTDLELDAILKDKNIIPRKQIELKVHVEEAETVHEQNNLKKDVDSIIHSYYLNEDAVPVN